MKGKMWMTSERWCLGGAAGAHEDWGVELMEKWQKSYINTWVTSESESLTDRWREVQLNIEQWMAEIL